MNSTSTAAASRTADTVAAVHAMTDQYVAANPQARPVPVMSWQEMQRLAMRGLVKFPDPPEEETRALTKEEQELRDRNRLKQQDHRERERKRALRLARLAAKPPLPRVETKQPEIWNTVKLHTEVETRFGHLEKGEPA